MRSRLLLLLTLAAAPATAQMPAQLATSIKARARWILTEGLWAVGYTDCQQDDDIVVVVARSEQEARLEAEVTDTLEAPDARFGRERWVELFQFDISPGQARRVRMVTP